MIDFTLVEDDTFLPCEFCQELFPFENLIAHQVSPNVVTHVILFDLKLHGQFRIPVVDLSLSLQYVKSSL